MLKVLALGRAVEAWSVQASRGSGSVLRGCSWAFLSCSCLRLNARVCILLSLEANMPR